MNYNFTDGVRRALALARTVAIHLRHDYVASEHMLLGLLRAAESDEADVAMCALERLHLTHNRIKAAMERMLPPGRAVIGRGELPYTNWGKKVLELAIAAARGLGDDFVGTEHLLLGLFRQEKGIASTVFVGLGVTDRALVEAIEAERKGEPRPGPALNDRAGAAVWFLEIDGESSTPIYEQIIARIEEAVAMSRLNAGERLPAVRDLAEELGVAPGTVARAYSALERKGVLMTEGARGTSVASSVGQGSRGPRADAMDALVELLRPAAVAAFHMSVGAQQVRDALEVAMRDIFPA
jgi:DNA-binding transcriptional regulator YhcF (GntR family)